MRALANRGALLRCRSVDRHAVVDRIRKARELLYMGDSIDAEEELRLGMVNKVVPVDELRAATLKFAKRMTLVSPEALYAAKLSINRGAEAAGFRNAINADLLFCSNVMMPRPATHGAEMFPRCRLGLTSPIATF